MDQPPVSEPLSGASAAEMPHLPIRYLTAELAESCTDASYVVIVRTIAEFSRWLLHPKPGAVLLQVEGLMGDPQGWALAAQGAHSIPLDVILHDPAKEYSALYRLVDVRNSRPLRVTISVRRGFMKALRLAVSLSIPVRLLPGQPGAELLAELSEAAEFYLRDSMVGVPVDYFHSVLAAFCQPEFGTLWDFLEQIPNLASDVDETQFLDPVEVYLAQILATGGECVTCRWQPICAGYFKYPDPTYDCAGVKQLFSTLEAAADEIKRDLAGAETYTSP